MVSPMRYLPAVLAIAVAVPVTLVAQRAERPTVAVTKVSGDSAEHDTLSLAHLIKRGMLLDSLVELVERPPADGRVVQKDGQMIRPARYVVTAIAQQLGDVRRVQVRVINAETSDIAGGESTQATAAALPDSLVAVGRRLARSLADASTRVRVRRP